MKTWGYILAGLVSITFIVGANAVNTWIPTLRDPQNYNTFIVADTIVPALILVAVLSVLSFVYRNKGLNQIKYLGARSITGVLSAVVIVLALAGAIGGAYADSVATAVYIPISTSVAISISSTSTAISSTSSQSANVSTSVSPITTTSTSTAVTSLSSGITPVLVRLEATGFIPQNLPGRYDPPVIKVLIGVNNTVTWTSDDYLLETVTSSTGVFDSGLLSQGNIWSYTFTSPGIYDYRSTTHPSQKGEVIVVSKS